MIEDEELEEKRFYICASKNLVPHQTKTASKGKFKKPDFSFLENDEPSIFVQKVAEQKEYIIYLKATGSCMKTIKDIESIILNSKAFKATYW